MAVAVRFDIIASLSNLVSLLFLSFIIIITTTSPLPLPLTALHHRHRRLADDIPGFISIDCGASEDYIYQRRGIPYKSDKGFTVSGINKQILPQFYGVLEPVYRDLRSFPEGIRNCYTLKPAGGGIGNNNKYLIRASFVYGNYDGKNLAPTFDLYLGVNLWDSGQWNYTYVEIIHVTSNDYIDVCLVKSHDNVPFISTLELRQLDNSIYNYGTDQNGQIFKGGLRWDMGAGVQQTRYPQDVYDRMWEPFECVRASSFLIRTNATMITSPNDNNDPYRLPEVMLQTACGTLNSSLPLNIPFWVTTAGGSQYFCFHFMEIEEHESGLVREMSIVLNGRHTVINSIKLDYLKPQTICSKGLPVNFDQYNTLTISATSTSTLPPILNGLEIYHSIDTPNSPTFLQDINAIIDIRQRYGLIRNWQGDPCNPPAFSWDGLNCSTTNPPRIISLNLSSSNLIGEIPSSLFSLTDLEFLDLSYNELKGPVPDFLARLQHLKILNITGNNLTGAIPESLLQKSEDGTLVLSVDGNPDLCPTPPCHKKKEFIIPLLCSIIGSLVLIIILLGVILMYKKKAKTKENSIQWKNNLNNTGSLQMKNRQYSYLEVVNITDNFRVTIGEGGFGKVYLGYLEDQTFVAVKVLSPSSHQGYKEFQSEAHLLMTVHHRNLVSLLGYCDDGDHKALIYEYMANGNLQQHLSGTNRDILSWIGRVQIAVDAAHGLEYLHNGCKPSIIHRDLKPANILLDKEMQAKIADFGLSRTFATCNESQILTRLAGTPGYVDLENQKYGNFDKKSDIYSFGILLLELITGCPAITRCSGGNIHILDWVHSEIKTGNIQHIVDSKLGEFNRNSAWKILELAISCTQPTTTQRPDMSCVLEELKQCLAADECNSSESLTLPTIILSESETAPCLR